MIYLAATWDGDTSDPTVDQSDPIEVAAAVFDGSPDENEIRAKVNEALRLYGNLADDRNIDGLVNVLVAMRQEYGYGEMQILDQMLCANPMGNVVDVPGSVALTIASMNIGDYC